MIISHGRKFIFVHVPKTGGTALSLALEDRAMADDILIGDTPKAVKRRKRFKPLIAEHRLSKHSKLSDMQAVLSPQELASYFKFTLVRNPWDWAVSYFHWLQMQTWDHHAVTAAKSLSFDAFLRDPVISHGLALPYGQYLTNRDGQEMEAHFFRLERLDEELAPLWDHLGFDLGPIARKNASERARDFRQYYSDADRDLVAQLCAVDIARFGYDFTETGLRS